VSPPAANRTLHERTKWVYEHLPEGIERVLDAGCHDGAATSAFANRARFAVGIDLDAAALQRGAREGTGVRLLRANGAALPFRDETFDCVVFSEVLEHVPSEAEEACVSELRRVTRPGGTLILTTPHRGSFWWLDPLMFKTHLRKAQARLQGRRVRLKGHKHYRVDEVRRLLDPYFDVRIVERPGRVLYPLAYWGHLIPFGLGRRPMLVQLWQYLMDRDYSREYGDAAYNVCIVARAR
jgi:SAM-dependent methyltransferase